MAALTAFLQGAGEGMSFREFLRYLGLVKKEEVGEMKNVTKDQALAIADKIIGRRRT